VRAVATGEAGADMIPQLDVAPLFGPPGAARDATDAAILAAATTAGFLVVGGLPPTGIDAAARRTLLDVFALPAPARTGLLRQKFEPANANVYRGMFPVQHGTPTRKEGYDLGPDVAHGARVVRHDDPLCEATPLPDPALLPGWHEAAARTYGAMEGVAAALMRALARGLGLAETTFDDAFRGGVSTLRLLRYPGDADGSGLIGEPHVDSGFLALLAQDATPGLEARAGNGWTPVPPAEGRLAVNFGRLLERWTGGRIRATEHRIVATGAERFSIPFFYEPRVDAEIAPLPLASAAPFAPFLYGDHVWAAMCRFIEFEGLEPLRPRSRIGLT